MGTATKGNLSRFPEENLIACLSPEGHKLWIYQNNLISTYLKYCQGRVIWSSWLAIWLSYWCQFFITVTNSMVIGRKSSPSPYNYVYLLDCYKNDLFCSSSQFRELTRLQQANTVDNDKLHYALLCWRACPWPYSSYQVPEAWNQPSLQKYILCDIQSYF